MKKIDKQENDKIRNEEKKKEGKRKRFQIKHPGVEFV